MEKILEVKNLRKTFYKSRSLFPAVEDVSFHLMRGECLGLVGESGCGKSTTARLIAGLLEPDRGSVRLEEEEILGLKGKKKQAVYTKLQMVFQTPQDSFDPRCTLGDGIMESMRNRGMKKDQARERMYRLLEQVELDRSFGERYPHEVSGGECQRAAIARALAVDPRLVICDEATSALDNESERWIQQSLEELSKDRTTITIAHRLSTIRGADEIIVITEDGIAERGTHESLLAKGGVYAHYYNM